jgi:hypothetical protein
MPVSFELGRLNTSVAAGKEEWPPFPKDGH